MLIDVVEYGSGHTVRDVKDKVDIPERYQQAVALLDAVDHVAANYAEDKAFLEGVGRKFIWYNLKRTAYYIESAFLEA